MLQNKTKKKKSTTISTMSSRNFKRLVSMEISRLNNLNNNSSSTTAAWPNEPFSSNTNLSPVMAVIKNKILLNSDNNSTITNNICDTIIPLSNVMNQTTNNIDVDKEIYPQENYLQLNLFSDNLMLSTMDTEIVKPPATHLNQKLCKLSLDYNISHNAMNEILSIFRSEGHSHVPKDVRTLLKTPTTHNIINIKPGYYIHIGIEYMLKPVLKKYQHYFNINSNKIKHSFNIDGLPISKCSRSAFWPILMSIINIPILINKVFTIGIYHSDSKKPYDVEEFLNPFIEEMLIILQLLLIITFLDFQLVK